MNVSLIGVSGYTGKELLCFLNKNTNIKEVKIYGHGSAGKTIWDIFPDFVRQIQNQEILPVRDIKTDDDLYFLATPHGKSVELTENLYKSGRRIIDLSANYRFDNIEVAKKIYHINYNDPSLLNKSIYALPELINSSEFSSKTLFANPGCYPTATLLSLYPLVHSFAENIVNISTTAYSGLSGAGRKANVEYLLSEMESNVKAYNVLEHRHEHEVKQELKRYSGIDLNFTVNMHLLPVKRGIYTTSVIFFDKSFSEESLYRLYDDIYQNKYFVRVRKDLVEMKNVLFSNFCDISLRVRDNIVVVNSCIDNLIKGASGQAIQNMNLIFGFDETASLC